MAIDGSERQLHQLAAEQIQRRPAHYDKKIAEGKTGVEGHYAPDLHGSVRWPMTGQCAELLRAATPV